MRFQLPGVSRRSALGLALVLLTVLVASPGLPRLEAGDVHPLYLTFGKLEVEGTSVTLEIRIFWDDLQLDMRRYSGDASLEVRGPNAAVAAVTGYINDQLLLQFDGQPPVRGELVEWGVDGDANRYRLRYVLNAAPRQVQVRHRILIDLYEDQKNVLHVQNRGARERAFYFARRAEEQTIRF
jgi:hypothetical protein